MATAIRLFLACIYFVSGYAKLRNVEQPKEFLTSVHVPKKYQTPLTRTLSAIEVITGSVLLFARWQRVAGVASALLLSSLTVVLGLSVKEGFQGNCGCFGKLERRRLGAITIGRNLFLIALSIKVARMEVHWDIWIPRDRTNRQKGSMMATQLPRITRRRLVRSLTVIAGGLLAPSLSLPLSASADEACLTIEHTYKAFSSTCRVAWGPPSTSRSAVTAYSPNGSWYNYYVCVCQTRTDAECVKQGLLLATVDDATERVSQWVIGSRRKAKDA